MLNDERWQYDPGRDPEPYSYHEPADPGCPPSVIVGPEAAAEMTFDVAIHDFYVSPRTVHTRARLAACAPELLDLLLHVSALGTLGDEQRRRFKEIGSFIHGRGEQYPPPHSLPSPPPALCGNCMRFTPRSST